MNLYFSVSYYKNRTNFCMASSTYEPCSALFDLNCNQLLGVAESCLSRTNNKTVQNSQEKTCNGILFSVRLKAWSIKQLFYRFRWLCLLHNLFYFWSSKSTVTENIYLEQSSFFWKNKVSLVSGT